MSKKQSTYIFTHTCKIILWLSLRSSQTSMDRSEAESNIIIWVESIAPQQFGRPLIFSNFDLIFAISSSLEGHWRWWSPCSSIASTNRQVTWETVEWFVPKKLATPIKESPELSLLKAKPTWSLMDIDFPFKKIKFDDFVIIGSVTSEHM